MRTLTSPRNNGRGLPGEYCEGCGKQRYKRESCQLTSHPNYNEKGLWIHSEGYRIKKAWLEAHGKGDEHPELRWYEYAGGGIIRGAHNSGEKARPEIHRVGNRPGRVQMSMATSQRRAGSSSRELRIVIHEEVRLEC
jgi:hypothetical protein